MKRFTDRARRVLALAQEEAERLNHAHIGIEHLLLGMLREEGGMAGRALRDLGIDSQRAEQAVVKLSPAGATPFNGRFDLTAGTKRVMKLTVAEARRTEQYFIGTEHLLLGFAAADDGLIHALFEALGTTAADVRRLCAWRMKPLPPWAGEADVKTDICTITGDFGCRSANLNPGTNYHSAALYYYGPSPTLRVAEEVARKYHRGHIDLIHMLIGIFRQNHSLGFRVLRHLGVDEQRIEAAMLKHKAAEQGEEQGEVHVEIALEVFRGLVRSTREARSQGRRHLKIVDWLLGIVSTDNAATRAVLDELGLTLERVREAIATLSGDAPPTEMPRD